MPIVPISRDSREALEYLDMIREGIESGEIEGMAVILAKRDDFLAWEWVFGRMDKLYLGCGGLRVTFEDILHDQEEE